MPREVSQWRRIGRGRGRKRLVRKTSGPNCIDIVGSHPETAKKNRRRRSLRPRCRTVSAVPGNRQDLWMKSNLKSIYCIHPLMTPRTRLAREFQSWAPIGRPESTSFSRWDPAKNKWSCYRNSALWLINSTPDRRVRPANARTKHVTATFRCRNVLTVCCSIMREMWSQRRCFHVGDWEKKFTLVRLLYIVLISSSWGHIVF